MTLPHFQIDYLQNFFNDEKADLYFKALQNELECSQNEIKIFGRMVKTPRLEAWYADSGLTYTYSGQEMQPKVWTKTLKAIKQEIEPHCKIKFNSVLVNWYRDGDDGVGYHSDDEPELGKNPYIASLSFGVDRKLKFQHKKDKLNHDLTLHHGSLLIMKGETQHYWKHALPKSKRIKDLRINLTFRQIKL